MDAAVGGAVVLLLVAIALTIAGGDQAGVSAVATSPRGTAPATVPVRVWFSEAMDPASVEAHFHISPLTDGEFTWNGSQLAFQPRRAWLPGVPYTVTIEAGAQSTGGRQVVTPISFLFTARMPGIVYLAPAIDDDSGVQRLMLVDSAQPGAARALVTTTADIEHFAPSPNGEFIAYSESGPRGTADLFLLHVHSGRVQPLTNCAAALARCLRAAWSPDGTRLAYERYELSAGIDSAHQEIPRVWMLSVDTLATAPLVTDAEAAGANPLWSPDGTQIAAYDQLLESIVIYNLATGERLLVPTLEGASGDFAFDPTGTRLAFPQLTELPGMFSSRLEVALLDDPARTVIAVTGDEASQVHDALPTWHPDAERLAFLRRSFDAGDARFPQVFVVRPGTDGGGQEADPEPLFSAPDYAHGSPGFDPTGASLLLQRILAASPTAAPEVVVYELATGEFTAIAQNAYSPRWIP